MAVSYSPGDIMVCAAAREIGDHQLVFVGMRLPMLAFYLAQATHAPNSVGLFENGVMRGSAAQAPVITMCDPPNQTGAIRLCDLAEVMTMLSGGRVDVGFIGGAQVDLYGNVNTHRVDTPQGPVRLPGSGGAADLACLAHKSLVIMSHEKRRLVPRVDFVTSPGWGRGGEMAGDGGDQEPGPAWRQAQGLARGGPGALITSLGVFRFPRGRAVLTQLHPGVTLEEVRAETGWELEAAPELAATPEPTSQELGIIRKFDPDRYWTG